MSEVTKSNATQVDDLAARMLTMPQVNCPVRHMFAPGQYIRELCMEKGTLAIGHRQRLPHLNVLVKGAVRMLNEDGTITEVRAPMVFVAPPGRKVGLVLEDVQWLNIYATDETDVEKLEALFLDKSPDPALQAKLLTVLPVDDDYPRMLQELGVSAEQVQAEAEDPATWAPFPAGMYRVKIGASGIHGRGLIATADIKAGDLICTALVDGKRTPAGRFMNHAKYPNAVVEAADGCVWVRSLRDIAGCRGGQDGEEITVDYRQAVAVAQAMRSLQ